MRRVPESFNDVCRPFPGRLPLRRRRWAPSHQSSALGPLGTPPRKQARWKWLFFLCWALVPLWARPAQAQQDFGSIDSNGLPAPATPGTFQTLQPATTPGQGAISLGVRSSLLLRPISGSQPSPSPAGTTSDVVSLVLLEELLVGAGITEGLDVGFAFPLHVFQQGQGLAPIGVGEPISAFAGGDPRLSLGVQWPLPVFVRSYLTAFLPLGSPSDFSGERAPRVELGTSLELDFNRVTLGFDLAVRAREVSEISLTRWGPQLRWGTGAAYRLTQRTTMLAELQLAPTLIEQLANRSEAPGYLLPAEIALGIAYELQGWKFAGLLGTGLPFSIPSEQSLALGPRRGPTSPLLRIGVDIRKKF